MPLPLPLTRLVGRQRELAAVERLLADNRLITLTGPAGSGKTRLAIELVARSGKSQFEGVAWTDLACCRDASLVPQLTASALAIDEMVGHGTMAVLIESLRQRDMLLVLDNCEHVIEACAEMAAELLSHCPRLRILATSREPLGIAGEQVWLVPPLDSDEAMALFADRAVASSPLFAIDEANREAVAEICRRLDGIPLAIELAAARIRMLTPEQMVSRLEDRFSMLSTGARASVARHRTLRAAIDWSFALLSPVEQRLLARLSVFATSFSLEAVERVSCDWSGSVLDYLAGLVDKSLVVTAGGGTAVRYYLLETIRQYAAERLAGEADAEDVRRRHAEVYLAIARDAAPRLSGAFVEALDRLDPEHQNVRIALEWGLRHDADGVALPLAASMRWYWYYRILWREGLRWLDRVLSASSSEATHDRASVLTAAATFGSYLGDQEIARSRFDEAESMWRQLGEERELGLCLSAYSQLLASSGDLGAAAPRASEAVALARKSGSEWDVAYCLTNAAAFVAQMKGDLPEADRHLEEAAAIWSKCHHALGLPFVLNARALVALRRGDHESAARFAAAALVESRPRRNLWFAARALRILAITGCADPERSARLLGAADSMLQATTARMLVYERSEYDQLVANLTVTLSPDALNAAIREGNGMAFEEACDFAVSRPAPPPPIAVSRPQLHIHDLGPLRITLDGQLLNNEGRACARARELLAFLAAHPEGRSRDQAGVAFWPDATAEQVKNSFHVTLHRLRRILGRNDIISAEGGLYRISAGVSHLIDSREFEHRITAALRGDSPEDLRDALALYEGDYLQGDDAGEWSIPIRSHLRQLSMRGLYALGQSLEIRGRFEDAADAYTRVLARDPFHEAAARQLMILRARLGTRPDSLLIYRNLEQRLRDDLQSTPEPETSALYRRLQANESV